MEPISARTNVEQVTKAVLILVEKEYKNHAWDRAKKMMNNVDQFKNRQAGNSYRMATASPPHLSRGRNMHVRTVTHGAILSLPGK